MNYYGPRPLLKEGADRSDWDESDVRGYHYTRRNDSRVWALGYCQGPLATTKEEWEEKMGPNAPDTWDEDESRQAKDAMRGLRANRKRMEMHGDKFHDEPHDTKEEAIECYTEYCLDFLLAFWHTEDAEWRRYVGADSHGLTEPMEADEVPADVRGHECQTPDCEVIVAYPTTRINAAGSPGGELYICGEHANRESIEEWWTAPESSMSSF